MLRTAMLRTAMAYISYQKCSFCIQFVCLLYPDEYLICCCLFSLAGIMFVKEETTEDGYEKHFAVNYLSHSLLTLLLLPLLSKSGTIEKHTRIVNSTSCIHYVGNNDILNFTEWLVISISSILLFSHNMDD